MNALLSQYRMLWRTLVGRRHPKIALAVFCMVTALILACGAAGASGALPWEHALRIGLGLPVVSIAVLSILCVLPGAVAQNTPVNARLVPLLRQRLRRLIILLWLVLVPSMAWLVPGVLGVWGATLYYGTFAICMGLSRAPRQRGLGTALTIALALLPVADKLWPALGAAMLGDAGLALGSVLMAALGAFAIRRLLPAAGNEHAISNSLTLDVNVHELSRFAGHWGRARYAAALRRDCQRRASPLILLAHFFGSVGHWSMYVQSTLLTLAGGGIAKFLLDAFGSPALQAKVAAQVWTIALLPLFGGFIFALVLLKHMSDTTAEQALLKMTPGFRDAGALNRALGRAMLGRMLVDWLAGVVLVLALLLIFGAPPAVAWRCLGVVALVLPLLCALLRDFARDKQPGGLWIVGWLLLGIALTAAMTGVLTLGFGVSPRFATPLAALLVGALGVTLRLRAMARAPAAFPAGRLAGVKGRA